MDNHHVAQYGLIAALAAGSAAGYTALSSRPPVVNAQHIVRASPLVWPPLTDAQTADLTSKLAPFAKGKTITVYCVNPNCADVADDVAGALKTAGAAVAVETPLNAADGLEVGSADPADADRLYEALKAASLAPKAGLPHGSKPYVSFGRRE